MGLGQVATTATINAPRAVRALLAGLGSRIAFITAHPTSRLRRECWALGSPELSTPLALHR